MFWQPVIVVIFGLKVTCITSVDENSAYWPDWSIMPQCYWLSVKLNLDVIAYEDWMWLVIQLTLNMTTTRIVEIPVTVNNSPFRTTCTLTWMMIFQLLMLFLKSCTLLDCRLPGRGPLEKAYVTLALISKFLLPFHKVTIGSWMGESYPGLTGNILHVISHKPQCSFLDICRDVLGSGHPFLTPSPS